MDFRKQNHKAPSVSAQRRICRDYLLLLPEDCMLQIAGEWYHCAGKQLPSYDSRWRLIFERLPGPSVPKGKTEPHIATRNLHTQQCRRASITAHSAQTQWDTMCSLYIASSRMRNLRELFKIAVWFCWPWNKNNIQAITTIKNDAQKWRLLFFFMTHNWLHSNSPSGRAACDIVNTRTRAMPMVFFCQPAGSLLPETECICSDDHTLEQFCKEGVTPNSQMQVFWLAAKQTPVTPLVSFSFETFSTPHTCHSA